MEHTARFFGSARAPRDARGSVMSLAASPHYDPSGAVAWEGPDEPRVDAERQTVQHLPWHDAANEAAALMDGITRTAPRA